MRFVFKMIVFPFWLITAFLALMLKWTLNLSAFVLALPMLYYFRLRSLYAVLPGVAAVFDFTGGRVWMLPAHHRRNSHCRSRGMVQRLGCRIIKSLCRHCAAFSFCREVVELAATRLIALLHKNKGKSVAACLKSRTDYAQNPDKTNKGELVSSYECSPLTADRRIYALQTPV